MKRFMLFALASLIAVSYGKAQVWSYDVYEGLLVDGSQITTNSITCEDDLTPEEELAQLIDGSTSTYYHSCWYSDEYEEYGPEGSGEYHYLQFDLLAAYDTLMFVFYSRWDNDEAYTDCPSDVILYATNDVDDDDSWVLVDSIFGITTQDSTAENVTYESDPIFSDTPYQYWRFVVIHTSTNRTESSYGETFFSLSEFQWYVPYYIDDQAEILAILVDSVADLELSFTTGTEPGYYDADLVAAYEEAYAAAEAATYETLTDEEYIAYGNALREALEAALDGIIPLEDGFYYIVSAAYFYEVSEDEDTYGEYISHTKAMYEDDGYLAWAELDSLDARFMWTITALDSGGYSVQNYATDNYIYGTDENYVQVPTSSSQEAAQYIVGLGDGTFAFYSELDEQSYHTNNHDSGEGESGTIVIWETSYSEDDRNIWTFEDIDLSEDVLAQLKDESYMEGLLEDLQDLVDSADYIYDAVMVAVTLGDGLITDASQFSSNAKEESEGDYESLLDRSTEATGDYDGFFHTEWSTSDCDEYHNLQVALYEPVESFVLELWARDNQSADDYVDFPTEIRIYATNDDNLGEDATSSNDEWTEVYFLEIEDPMNTVGYRMGYQYQSDPIEAGAEYQYYRFVVENTATYEDGSGRCNTTTGIPYFTLSEFQMYEYTEDEENAQYNYVEGMQEAVDAMMEAVTEAEASIEEGTTSETEVEALRELVLAVYDLYVYTDDYDDLLSEAEALLSSAVVGEGIGYVSQEGYDALESAIENAESTKTVRPTKETVAAAIEILEEGIAAFDDALEKVELGTWYYIISGSSDEDYAGQYMYAGSVMYGTEGVLDGLTMFGGLDENGEVLEETLTDLRYMWRLVENEDSTYSLQNRLYGVGPCSWEGYYYAYLDESNTYNIEYVGDGLVALYYEDEDETVYSLQPYSYYDACVTDPYGIDSYAYWQMVKVDIEASEDTYVTMPALNNNIIVRTYPFNISTWGDGAMTVAEFNEDVYTYAVKNCTYDESTGVNTVELTLQDEFAAGEPFVLVTGDYENYGGYTSVDETDTIDIYLPVPTEFTEEPGTSNGLVGNFMDDTITKEGIGYIDWDDESLYFYISDEDTDVYLWFNNGYFVPVTEVGTGSTDLTITFEGSEITSVISTTVTAGDENEKVKVYDLNGRLLKSGVATSEATSGLQKGVYIVGGKKVIVK